MAREPIEVTQASIAMQQAIVDSLTSRIEELRKDLRSIEEARFTIDEEQAKIARAEKDLVELEARRQAWESRAVTTAAPFTVRRANGAEVAEDRRPTMATFGFVAGGALPVLGVLLYGLRDRKYRYSDEATATGSTRGIPLLGILPNLPDRLSDPGQATVAAHCVHQIRTMLQLNSMRGDEPSILAITRRW